MREMQFVEAAKSDGTRRLRIIFRHILPSCIAPVIVVMTLDASAVIIFAASLSFIGFGAQPPLPEWGSMASTGRNYLLSAWWTSTFPGLAIFLVALGLNLLGDGLRDALDPTLRRLLEVTK